MSISIRHHSSVLDGRRAEDEMTTHSSQNMKQVFVREGCEYEWEASDGYFPFYLPTRLASTRALRLFFISSSFVPSRQSALESNPVLVRVKSKIPGAGLLTLSTIRLNFDLWMKIITSFACYVYSYVLTWYHLREKEEESGVEASFMELTPPGSNNTWLKAFKHQVLTMVDGWKVKCEKNTTS